MSPLTQGLNYRSACDSDGRDVESDQNVTVDNGDVPVDDDLASHEQVAKEQRDDQSLKGCFSLAKAGKGGFVIQDGLLYYKKTVLGETYI